MAIYMQYDGIKGDTTEDGHKEWIKCDSASFCAFREAKTKLGHGGSRQGTNVSIADIAVTKPMCSASPHLFVESLVGLGKKVKIHITRTGAGEQINYLEAVLDKCCVTNYGITSDGVRHSESFSLNFLTIELKCTPVKPDGTPGTPVPVAFSIPTGEPKVWE
jgi:type VI secretion system secreted protein Hcp